MGVHINLWEHAFISPNSPIYDSLFKYSCDYEVLGGLVPDFSVKKVSEIFSDYHKDNFTALGIDGFKLDENLMEVILRVTGAFRNVLNFRREWTENNITVCLKP